MNDYYHFRVWCTTENAWVDSIVAVPAGDPEPAAPTTCPNDDAHTIDTNLTSIEYKQLQNAVAITNTVHIDKPMDTLNHIYSHDFAKPETWYSSSVQADQYVFGAAVAGQTEFSLPHNNVIDLTHGKVTGEDFIKTPADGSYVPVVQVNDVVVAQQNDFHYGNNNDPNGVWRLDGAPGEIWFKPGYINAGDIVKVDYWYNPFDINNTAHNVSGNYYSLFKVTPPAGQYIKIESIEVQFTTNIEFNDTIVFKLTAAGGAFTVMEKRHKTMDNLQDDALRVNPQAAASGGTGPRGQTNATSVMTWDYISAFPIYSSQAMSMDIYLEHDQPFGPANNARATATVYTKLFDE
jgi:hypothetical protein